VSADQESKTEPIRRLYERINAGAIDAALQELSPDVTWSRPPDVPRTGTLRGRARVGAMWRGFARPLQRFEIAPTRHSTHGDQVLVHVTFRGTTESGDEFEFSGVQVFRVQAGEITEVLEFRRLPDARAAIANA
jgi:ketosteroid isomerase-like protein